MYTNSSGTIDKETGKPRLLSRSCATCIGRPDGVELRPGRLKELVQQNTGPQAGGLICHSTIEYTEDEDGESVAAGSQMAYCRWFFNQFGHLVNYFRICERFGGFTEVDPPQSLPW